MVVPALAQIRRSPLVHHSENVDRFEEDHDLILTALPVDEDRLTVAPLLHEPLKLVMSAEHRLAKKRRHDQRQRWRTFLRNHSHGIAAMDFLVVPIVRFRLLYAWFVIGHGRRKIIHFGVTAHPTSSWVVQQLREAFPNDASPRFLIYDNDSIFSDQVTESIKNIGIEPHRTAFYS